MLRDDRARRRVVDATNIATRIERDGNDLVITGRKWWITGPADPRCRIALVLGVSDPDARVHQRHSVVLVPPGTPGVVLVRDLTVFGYHDREVRFDGARVPAANLLGPAGAGFVIAQSRLGPGRVHYCMCAIGMSARARADDAPGPVADRVQIAWALDGVVRRDIAESRITIEQLRLLVHKTAWLLDTAGYKGARIEGAAIKAAVPRAAAEITDRARTRPAPTSLTAQRVIRTVVRSIRDESPSSAELKDACGADFSGDESMRIAGVRAIVALP